MREGGSTPPILTNYQPTKSKTMKATEQLYGIVLEMEALIAKGEENWTAEDERLFRDLDRAEVQLLAMIN